jgi:hypothetical protein
VEKFPFCSRRIVSYPPTKWPKFLAFFRPELTTRPTFPGMKTDLDGLARLSSGGIFLKAVEN